MEKHRKTQKAEGDLSVSVRLAVGPESRFSSQLANVKDSVKKNEKPKRKDKKKAQRMINVRAKFSNRR